MRKLFIDLTPPVLAVLLVLLSLFSPANAAQVVTEDLRQWARQAVSEEASMDIKPAADTVAVLYFENQTERSDLDFLKKGMTIMLITDLAKVEGINVVERNRLQALLQEMKMGATGIVAEDTAPRMGNLLGAGYLVGGSLGTAQADRFDIDAGLLEVVREALLGSPTSSGTMNELLRMEKEILFEIVRLLRIDLTDEQETELRKPITTNIKALIFLVRGIDSSDMGDYAQAAEYYRKALELDPDLEVAESAVEELEDLGLIPSQSGARLMLRKLRKRVSVNTGPIPDQITRRHKSEPASVQGPAGAAEADVRLQW